MTVSLGMHTVGDGEATKDDSQMTRRVSKVVMHNGYSVVNEASIHFIVYNMSIAVVLF